MAFEYYIHDGSKSFRFRLLGQLSAVSARDLELAWETAHSTIGNRDIVFDVTRLTGIDATGHELLRDWKMRGAKFVVADCGAHARLQSMTDQPIALATPRKPSLIASVRQFLSGAALPALRCPESR